MSSFTRGPKIVMKPERVVVPTAVVSLLHDLGRIADALHLPVYAVGGCVRDWLLGIKQTPDLDVTVEGNGLWFARQAASQLGAELVEHQQFGTATLSFAGKANQRIDIASCRKESYSRPAAYPKVVAGKLRSDLVRRDFSVNAMAVSINDKSFGSLTDPFKGKADLSKGCLRVLHERSFIDDPSRILRGIRFMARFGFHWETATRKQAVEAIAAGGLGELNFGRLAREMDAMTDEPDPKACFDELALLISDAEKLRR